MTAGAPGFLRWMISRLEREGFTALIVGGAVRDMCMARKAEDWDLVTAARPDVVQRVFSQAGAFRLHPETVTVVSEGRTFHVSSLGAAGDRGALEQDLARRDFTINAMAYDLKAGRLVDPFGGVRDIELRLVRATGSPAWRFREDPLRLLRAARFACTLGFAIEKATLEEMESLGGAVMGAAPERVRDELMRVLLAPTPSRGLRLMQRTGLLRAVLPEIDEGHLKRQNSYHRYTILRHTLETVDRVEAVPELRLAALLHDSAKPGVRTRGQSGWRFTGHAEAGALLAREILGRLRFSRELTGRVVHLVRHHMIGYTPEWGDAAVRRWIRRIGPENTDLLLRLRRADIEAHGRPDYKGDLLDELAGRAARIRRTAVDRRGLAIDGRTVMGVTGLQPGPEVGRILDRLVELVTERPELNTEASLVRLLRAGPGRGEGVRMEAKGSGGGRES